MPEITIASPAGETPAQQRILREGNQQLCDTLLEKRMLLAHKSQCKIRANDSCSVCKRTLALLQIHSAKCEHDNCPWSKCMDIREQCRLQEELNHLLRKNSKILLVTQQWKRDGQILETENLARQSKKIDHVTQRWRRDGNRLALNLQPDKETWTNLE